MDYWIISYLVVSHYVCGNLLEQQQEINTAKVPSTEKHVVRHVVAPETDAV